MLKQQFPDVPIIALTATATKRVCDDLKSMLRIEACESFSASVNRPNLLYEVTMFPGTKLSPWPTSGQFMLLLNDALHARSDSQQMCCLISLACVKLVPLGTAEEPAVLCHHTACILYSAVEAVQT